MTALHFDGAREGLELSEVLNHHEPPLSELRLRENRQ